MTFADPLPVWALIMAGVVAALIAVLAYSQAALPHRRRSALGVMRFLTLLLLVVLLMRPLAPHGEGESDAVVPVLVDTSRSMSIADTPGGRRLDVARAIVNGELRSSRTSGFRTEVLAFGESLAEAEPEQLEASARRSDLAAALEAVAERYRGRAVAGIVLLSDGGETTQPQARETGTVPWPVFAVRIGSEVMRGDREVLGVTALEAVLDHSRIDLAVSAVSHGYGSEPFELRLLENGRLVDLRRVRPSSDGTPIREVFQVTPASGTASMYTVEIPAASGELVPENNARSVLVQPPARPRRVLLIQGAPGYEHSFLRRAWTGDAGLEVDSVVRQGRDEQGAGTFYIQASSLRSAALASGFPAARDALFAYDAVVLANVGRLAASEAQFQQLREFVGHRGGGLLVLGAQSFLGNGLLDSPIEDLIPLALTDRRESGVVGASLPPPAGRGVALTPAGDAHPIMQLAASPQDTRRRWDALPPLASLAPLGGPRPGASVLALAGGGSGSARPLVAVQRYGEGRTMAFTGEASWRWRMRLPSGDGSYDMFWRQAVRWLSLPAADPVALSLPDDAVPGDLVTIRLAVRTPAFEPLATTAVTVRMTRPDGRIDEVPVERAAAGPDVSKGVVLARYHVDDPGIYRVAADAGARGGVPLTAAGSMLVGGSDPEMADPRTNLRVLQRLAAASGGRVIEADAIAGLMEELRGSAPAAVRRARRDLWHSPWVFAAMLALLAGEWMLRRRWGLR